MTRSDDETTRFYSAEAQNYATRGQACSEELDAFLALLPAGGAILELGCGGGQDSEAMLAKGFDVTPTDGIPEIALVAEKRLGRKVRVLLFNDLDEFERYDGIWANACLLHVPRNELQPIISRIHAALKAGGVFFASFKAGTAEGRDAFQRYFNYPSADWLRSVYSALDWQSLVIEEAEGSGYDRQPTDWLYVTAMKR